MGCFGFVFFSGGIVCFYFFDEKVPYRFYFFFLFLNMKIKINDSLKCLKSFEFNSNKSLK